MTKEKHEDSKGQRDSTREGPLQAEAGHPRKQLAPG